jgi:phospholipase/lecithinase/hemolysin
MGVSAGNRLVRHFLAMAVGLAGGAAMAGPFSGVAVFGDSLSDVGNVSQATPILFGLIPKTPGPYYWNGRFSNGPVYAESLASGLSLPPLVHSASGGNNFAHGGAKTTGTNIFYSVVIRDVDDQVGDFLAGPEADPNALFTVFAGANDLIDGQTIMSVPVSSLQESISRLVMDGARQFLVFNLPPLGETPRFNGSQSTRDQYNMRSDQFNTALATMLDGIETSNSDVTIHRLDVNAMFEQVLADPAAFGLVNVTAPAAPGLEPGATSYNTSQIVPNPHQYLFWDDLHPTAAVHAILAQRALDLFRLPGDFNHDDVVDAADYVVWRNGVGTTYIPYDYQIWRAHFGESAGSGAAEKLGAGNSTVPELNVSVLVGWAVVGIAMRRSRRIAYANVFAGGGVAGQNSRRRVNSANEY